MYVSSPPLLSPMVFAHNATRKRCVCFFLAEMQRRTSAGERRVHITRTLFCPQERRRALKIVLPHHLLRDCASAMPLCALSLLRTIAQIALRHPLPLITPERWTQLLPYHVYDNPRFGGRGWGGGKDGPRFSGERMPPSAHRDQTLARFHAFRRRSASSRLSPPPPPHVACVLSSRNPLCQLPVHCAAAGGNVSLLAWLIEDRCCPIFRNEDKTYPLLDAKGRSVMAAAAHSGQVKIMRYLTFTQPSTVMDVGWVALWRGLHLCLSQGEAGGKGGSSGGGCSGRNSGSGDNSISDVCGWAPYSGVSAAKSSCGGGVQQSCYPLGGGIEGAAWRNDGRGGGGGGGYHDDEWVISAGAGGDEGNPLAQAVLGGADDGGYAVYDMPGTRSQNDDIGRGGGGGKGKNVCIVCFARKVNCTFVPCGHHCCCMPCTAKFELCPVCNVRITQKVKAIDA
ncbi:unnamed protein product [Scytosiphon promiscuus]